jgi:hypothetical protein
MARTPSALIRTIRPQRARISGMPGLGFGSALGEPEPALQVDLRSVVDHDFALARVELGEFRRKRSRYIVGARSKSSAFFTYWAATRIDHDRSRSHERRRSADR